MQENAAVFAGVDRAKWLIPSASTERRVLNVVFESQFLLIVVVVSDQS